MRIVMLDETIKECKRGYEAGEPSGNVVGQVRDTEEHIYVEALPVSASGRDGRQCIGTWGMCETPASALPSSGEGVELFLSYDGDDISAFYQGIRVGDVQVVNYRTDFSARIQGIVDCELLAEKRVFVIGAGSVGSKMAMHFARSGVGRFTIVDFDQVEVANLCRCEYLVEDIGRYKTLALRDKLLSVNPWLEVETYQQNVMHMEDDELIGLIQRSDMVVSAADDPAAEHRLNALAHSIAPVVYPALYSRAAGGEVIFTIPGGACYQCVVGTLRSVQNAPSKGEWDYTTAGDLKAEPGLGIDIDYVVTIASKMALALLMRDVEGSDIAGLIDEERTAVFVSNQRQEMYGVPFNPFEIAWADTSISESCPICQTSERHDEELLAQVRALVEKASTVDLPEVPGDGRG